MVPTCTIHKAPVPERCISCARELAFLRERTPIDVGVRQLFRMRRDSAIKTPLEARAAADAINKEYFAERAP